MSRNTFLLIVSSFVTIFFAMELHAAPPEVTSFLDDKKNGVSEDGLLPETPPQVLDFARYVVGNWQLVQASFNALAPDARRQNMIVVAAEFLPPHDYVTFTENICDLKASGKVTLETIRVVTTARMFKNGFLAFNYNKPEVAAVITKLETIMQAGEPGKWTTYFTDIKAGKAKQAVIAERTKDGEPMPESYDAGPSDAYRQLMGTH